MTERDEPTVHIREGGFGMKQRISYSITIHKSLAS